MAEVPFRPVRQLSEYKGKGASASREKICVTSGHHSFPHLLIADWLIQISPYGGDNFNNL